MPFATHVRKLMLAGLATLATVVGIAAPPSVETEAVQAAEIAPVPSCDAPASRFSMAVLPDTQFYSRYAAPETGDQYTNRYGSQPFASQTQWIVDNAATYDTRFTMHLGDVVDQVNHPEQWQVASDAMEKLEDAGQPYSILAGNHDVDGSSTPYDTYTSYFSKNRAEQNSTFLERDPQTGGHEAHLLNVDGQDFLILSLSWDANQAGLDWAEGILKRYPGVPTILNSHQLINVADDAITPIPTDFGERVWNQLIAPYDQVFLTFNGHHHGATEWTRTNNAGNPVHQVLMDYQMAYAGGNGYMGLVEFDLTNGVISQTSFSPWVMEKPAEVLVPEDQAVLDGAGQSFSIPFDFKSRFPNLVTGAAQDACATGQLRDYIAQNYQAPAPREHTSATGPEDYVKVDGTVAHWIMPTDQADGTVAPVGATVEDIAGGNTFTRQPINEDGIVGAAEDDVTWTTSHHPLSANFGGVCFDDANKNINTASYFETAAGAPINDDTFPNGYTLETFVKISPEFTVENNAWMAWLSRDGKRGELPGYMGGDADEPPMAFAFSTLKEVQYSFADTQNPPRDPSAWSGEIVNTDQWMHLAVVNDPATMETVMYVDGVPVLRNSTDTIGLAAIDELPWVMGAGSYAGARQSGFIGCIGETRIVDHPIDQEQWLTARAPVVAPPSPTDTASPVPVEPTSPMPSATPGTDSSAAPADEVVEAADGDLAGTGQALGTFGLIVSIVSAIAVVFGLMLLRRRQLRNDAE